MSMRRYFLGLFFFVGLFNLMMLVGGHQPAWAADTCGCGELGSSCPTTDGSGNPAFGICVSSFSCAQGKACSLTGETASCCGTGSSELDVCTRDDGNPGLCSGTAPGGATGSCQSNLYCRHQSVIVSTSVSAGTLCCNGGSENQLCQFQSNYGGNEYGKCVPAGGGALCSLKCEAPGQSPTSPNNCCLPGIPGQRCETQAGKTGICTGTDSATCSSGLTCDTSQVSSEMGKFNCLCTKNSGGDVQCHPDTLNGCTVNGQPASGVPDTRTCRDYAAGERDICTRNGGEWLSGRCSTQVSCVVSAAGGHGDSCRFTSECNPPFECWAPSGGQKRCLYAASSRGGPDAQPGSSSCLVAQECKYWDADPDPRNSPFTGRWSCKEGQCRPNNFDSDNESETYALCEQVSPAFRVNCEDCALDKGIWTAFGCIKYGNNGLNIVKSLLVVGLSLASGVVLITILVAGLMLTTSRGDPKRVTEAKEMITAAVVGVLFIALSVTILQFIGVSVLKIPGFAGN